MTDENTPDTSHDSEIVVKRIDELCDNFEHQMRQGQLPKIETYLSAIDPCCYERLLLRLLEVEIELLQHAGQQVNLDSYLARFPDNVAIIHHVFAVNYRTDDYAPTEHPTEKLPRSFGRFELLRFLKGGSFGKVYLALDNLGRQVAVKISRAELDVNVRQGLFREASICAAILKHPGIVTIYEAGEVNGTCYISEEYIAGGDLKTFLSKQKDLDSEAHITQTVALMIAIAEAVAHAHKQGVYHRDLKPANILLDDHGQPKIADFGLAILESQRLAYRGHSAGTRDYMSPEQITRDTRGIDGRTDVWSLGAIFFQMLTGRLPFLGDSQQLCESIKYLDPSLASQFNNFVPRELSNICNQCLNKDVSQRLLAMELAEQLRIWRDSWVHNEWTEGENPMRLDGVSIVETAEGRLITTVNPDAAEEMLSQTGNVSRDYADSKLEVDESLQVTAIGKDSTFKVTCFLIKWKKELGDDDAGEIEVHAAAYEKHLQLVPSMIVLKKEATGNRWSPVKSDWVRIESPIDREGRPYIEYRLNRSKLDVENGDDVCILTLHEYLGRFESRPWVGFSHRHVAKDGHATYLFCRRQNDPVEIEPFVFVKYETNPNVFVSHSNESEMRLVAISRLAKISEVCRTLSGWNEYWASESSSGTPSQAAQNQAALMKQCMNLIREFSPNGVSTSGKHGFAFTFDPAETQKLSHLAKDQNISVFFRNSTPKIC